MPLHILPAERIQNKIDYYLGPYNWRKMINKFMNFDDETGGINSTVCFTILAPLNSMA